MPQQPHADRERHRRGCSRRIIGLSTDRWTIEPPQATFQLAAGEKCKFPFDIRLKNALFGKQPMRIEFNVEADEQYQFSVYTEMEVGTADLTLEVKTHLDKDGTLIVEQLMTNSAEQLADFRCYLYAQGHRRQRMQVYRLGQTWTAKSIAIRPVAAWLAVQCCWRSKSRTVRAC